MGRTLYLIGGASVAASVAGVLCLLLTLDLLATLFVFCWTPSGREVQAKS